MMIEEKKSKASEKSAAAPVAPEKAASENGTRRGRPAGGSSGVKITAEGEYFVVKIPRKIAVKSLLGELLN